MNDAFRVPLLRGNDHVVVLIVGAGGFIGRHIAKALEASGARVVRARRPQVDLARDHDAAAWLPHLEGIDVAVNAAGVFRERPGEDFEAIHVRGPVALFEACARRGVKVVHVSALGADEGAASAFHRTKRRADDALLALDVPSVVLQPSLVYGEDGASARLFATLASLPLVPLPGRGEQPVQPVHVEDVAAALAALVREDRFTRSRLPLVGPAPIALRDFLAALRAAMGLGRPRFLPVPDAWMDAAARLGIGMLDRDALAMLRRGNTADAGGIAALLGRAPRAYTSFVESPRAARAAARVRWLAPLLRVALAAMWIIAGVVSAFFYPLEDSLALLARTGLTGGAALAALYGAAALDLALGVATLVMKRRRALWIFQFVLVLAYTVIITVALPEQWLHPYGPVAKNLPILAAIALLHALEER
jgi:uncharacterized protein YbjT (DUF2867 family)